MKVGSISRTQAHTKLEIPSKETSDDKTLSFIGRIGSFITGAFSIDALKDRVSRVVDITKETYAWLKLSANAPSSLAFQKKFLIKTGSIIENTVDMKILNSACSFIFSLVEKDSWNSLDLEVRSLVTANFTKIVSRRDLDRDLRKNAASCLVSFTKEPQWSHLNDDCKRSVISGLAEIISENNLDRDLRKTDCFDLKEF
jgi:hypothetical protein